MNQKHRYFNSKGFGLAEAVVAMGLLGFLILGIMAISKLTGRMSGDLDSKLGLLRLQSDLREVLMHQGTCMAAMTSRRFQTTDPTTMVLRLNGREVSDSGAGREQFEYGVRVTRLQFVNPRLITNLNPTDAIYSATLRMGADSIRDTLTKFSDVNVGILYLRIRGTDIVDCLAGRDISDPSTVICTTFGGTPTSGGGCHLDPRLTRVSCGPGEYLQGFDIRGNPTCAAVP